MKSMPSLTKFEDVLNKEGELIFTNVGYSMYPLIKQREDVLRIVKTDNYKKGDIVLYKSEISTYLRIRRLEGSFTRISFISKHSSK